VPGGGRFGTAMDGADLGDRGLPGHRRAHRHQAAGRQVIDVPPKLFARARVFATGHCRKTHATDAHLVALPLTSGN
jgi:hypothetical protein